MTDPKILKSIDKTTVIENLEKVWDVFNYMGHEEYADYVFDALALLKSYEIEVNLPNIGTITTFMPNACERCANHPSNGGSGICHCILGMPTVTA